MFRITEKHHKLIQTNAIHALKFSMVHKPDVLLCKVKNVFLMQNITEKYCFLQIRNPAKRLQSKTHNFNFIEKPGANKQSFQLSNI